MIRPIRAIVMRNLIKFSRDRMRLLFTLIMSGLFLFIFSFVTKSTAAGLDHLANKSKIKVDEDHQRTQVIGTCRVCSHELGFRYRCVAVETSNFCKQRFGIAS